MHVYICAPLGTPSEESISPSLPKRKRAYIYIYRCIDA